MDTVVNMPESSSTTAIRPMAGGVHLRGAGSGGGGEDGPADINAKGYITFGPLPSRGNLNEREAALTEKAIEVTKKLMVTISLHSICFSLGPKRSI